MSAILDAIGKVTIIVDSREHKLVTVFNGMRDLLLKENIELKIKELNSADFAITIDNKPHMLIERKTITDYAQSIKDKRLEKRNIMYAQRVKTKCDLSFIIEGDISSLLVSNAKDKTCGILNTSIKTSIFNLQVRDKMFLYFSQTLFDSALIIYNLAKSYFKNIGSEQQLISKNLIEEKLLTMSVGCSDCEILCKMFLQIPGITKANVHFLLDRTFNEVYSLCNSICDNELKKNIGTRAVNSLVSINKNDGKDLFWRIIMQIPNVSERYKEKVYPIAGYNEFLMFNPEFLQQVLHILEQKTSTVTVNINRFLLYVVFESSKSSIEVLNTVVS